MSLAPLVLSFEVAALATLVAGLVGVALATLLARGRFAGRDLLDVLVTAPMVLPPTVLGYFVLVALGRRSPVGQLFESLTGSSIVFTRTGAVIAAAIGSLPLVVKGARTALEGVDERLVLAARTLGAGPARAYFTVHLPLAAPGIVAATMLGFARALGDFGVTLMVAGSIPGVTRTAALAIYDAVEAGRDAEARAMVAVLTAIAVALLYGVNKLAARPRD
jgi:molybdate transport system permease protein